MKLSEQITAAEKKSSAASAAEQRAKEAKAEADAAWRAVWERMEAEDIEEIRVRGTRYGRQITEFGVIQDQYEFQKWAEVHAPELFQPKPRKALINQLAEKYLEDGKELPPGLGTFPKPWVSKRQV